MAQNPFCGFSSLIIWTLQKNLLPLFVLGRVDDGGCKIFLTFSCKATFFVPLFISPSAPAASVAVVAASVAVDAVVVAAAPATAAVTKLDLFFSLRTLIDNLLKIVGCFLPHLKFTLFLPIEGAGQEYPVVFLLIENW